MTEEPVVPFPPRRPDPRLLRLQRMAQRAHAMIGDALERLPDPPVELTEQVAASQDALVQVSDTVDQITTAAPTSTDAPV